MTDRTAGAPARAPARRGLWRGLVLGFALGSAVTFGGLLAIGLWSAHLVQQDLARGGPRPHGPGPPGAAVDTAVSGLRTGYRGWVEDLDGRRVALASLRGRVAVVHVWATWCAPCVRELPRLQALADSLRAEDVRFLLVSEERRERVAAFVARRRLRLPVYVAGSPLPPEFRTAAIPATFVVRRDGTVAARSIGAADWDAEWARRLLRRLL